MGFIHLIRSHGDTNVMLLCSAVPQAAEFLDPQPLSKGKTEKKNKKKNAEKQLTSQLDAPVFMTVPVPVANGSASPAAVSGAASASNGSPAPRPGFSRISSAVIEAESSKGGTPVPADRSKVVIGLGTKRKAGEESRDTPPPKRR